MYMYICTFYKLKNMYIYIYICMYGLSAKLPGHFPLSCMDPLLHGCSSKLGSWALFDL